MPARRDDIGIGSFACSFGDLECKPADIPGFDDLWDAESSNTDFAAMGCGSFRKMSGPAEDYAAESVRRSLAGRAAAAEEIDYAVFATSDATLRRLGRDFAVRVLQATGMISCVPLVVSFQQCCSSLTGLRYGWELFADEDVNNVVLVSVDFTPDDRDRVRSFALFSDAAVSCVISRAGGNRMRLVSSAVNVDYPGLSGHDSFMSRRQVAQASFARTFRDVGPVLGDVTKVFPTNLYKPVTLFNATVAGVQPAKLHFADTLHAYGHCGNCDWMINLADYREKTGTRAGETYLAQASAPGFFACALLEQA
jgi:3-oxoacyl-[acyl-carrier-protein] synthase III